eukprot:scaffold2640_cov376-Prasinococcus_capsulatus_cf.AAC.14
MGGRLFVALLSHLLLTRPTFVCFCLHEQVRALLGCGIVADILVSVLARRPVLGAFGSVGVRCTLVAFCIVVFLPSLPKTEGGIALEGSWDPRSKGSRSTAVVHHQRQEHHEGEGEGWRRRRALRPSPSGGRQVRTGVGCRGAVACCLGGLQTPLFSPSQRLHGHSGAGFFCSRTPALRSRSGVCRALKPLCGQACHSQTALSLHARRVRRERCGAVLHGPRPPMAGFIPERPAGTEWTILEWRPAKRRVPVRCACRTGLAGTGPIDIGAWAGWRPPWDAKCKALTARAAHRAGLC